MANLRVELANRIGKINGRSCAVGNDWIAVDKGPDGRHSNVVRRFGEDEAACRSFVEEMRES